MRRGRPLKPLITTNSLLAALKTLDYSAQAQSGNLALENLQLIDYRLQHAVRPSAEDIRAWMLRKILVDLITQSLNQHRQYFTFSPVKQNETHDTAIRQLRENFATDSEYLKGWSLLYLRYVRPEFNFSMQDFADLTSAHRRTLQRYQDTAIHLLRDALTDAEWTVRKSQQQAYLRSRIPVQITQLIGRDAELNQISSCFEADILKPIVISGEAGIGKTALTAFVANDLIDHRAIDYLLWLKQPDTLSYITNKIWDTVLPYPTQQHWREVLEFQRLLLVIDGIDAINLQSDEWATLLADVQPAFVMLLNPAKPVFAQSVQHIELENLSRIDSLKLIGSYPGKKSDNGIKQQEIVDVIGGNPRNLLYATQLHQKNIGVGDDIQTQFHRIQFEKLSLQEKGICVLSAATGFSPGFISAGLYPDTNFANGLFDFPAKFIQAAYHRDSILTSAVIQQIESLIAGHSRNSHFIEILSNLVSCEWLQLDENLLRYILTSLDVSGISIGQARQWRQSYLRHFALHPMSLDTMQLNYQYGIVLRRLFERKEAMAYLQKLLVFLGQTGQFALQLKARYEIALLHQSAGEYERAITIYEQIDTLTEKYHLADLSERVRVQLARLAIDCQKPDDAINHLEALSFGKPEIFALYCEAQVLRGEFDFIVRAVPAFLESQRLSKKIKSSFHTILARSYQQKALYSDAIIHFNEALTIAEQSGNQFDIARAKTNLGAIYLMIDDKQENMTSELETLFLEARTIQIQIKDVVGLEASNRNLLHLQRNF